MKVSCPNCNHQTINPHPGSICEVCGASLASAAPTDANNSGKPIDSDAVRPGFTGQVSLRERPVPKSPSQSGRGRFAAPSSTGGINRPISPGRHPGGSKFGARQGSPSVSSAARTGVRGRSPVQASAPMERGIRAQQPPVNAIVLEGTITGVHELPQEAPDANIAGIFASLILIIDLVLVFGWIALIVIVTALFIGILLAILNPGCLGGILRVFTQSIFFFLGPLISILFRNRTQDRNLQPVTNYKLYTANGQETIFRIKGRLRGATPQKGERVRVWGRWRDDILRTRGGQNLNSGERYLYPFNWSIVWLFLLLFINTVGFFFLRAQLHNLSVID